MISIFGEGKEKAKWNRERLLHKNNGMSIAFQALVCDDTEEKEKDMLGYCDSCKYKETCFRPCYVVSEYINQDTIRGRRYKEIPFSHRIENIPSGTTAWQESTTILGKASWWAISGARLTKKQRDALYARYWLRKPLQKIEEEMNIGKKTLWKHLNVAKVKIMVFLNDNKKAAAINENKVPPIKDNVLEKMRGHIEKGG